MLLKSEVLKRINPKILEGVAHRGLHSDVLTENGMKAFKAAVDAQCAIELDVHLAKDGKLIVCHDSELYRTTGKKGIIEDLTSQEIRDNYKLLDGGVVPTFQEVLTLVNEEVPLVVEMKTYRKNNKELAQALKNELVNVEDKRNFVIIAFDPRALMAFGKEAGYMRMLLVIKDGKHDWIYLFRNKFEGVDLDHRFLKKASVRHYAKKHFMNVWTIDNPELLQSVAKYADTVTFQFIDPLVVRNTLKK